MNNKHIKKPQRGGYGYSHNVIKKEKFIQNEVFCLFFLYISSNTSPVKDSLFKKVNIAEPK